MQDFMQFGFSEEASELVNDFLDFGGTCMRPTGELYGISGGKCRKGSESEPAKKRSNLHMRAYIRLMKKAKERGKPADTSGYHSHHAFPKSIFTNKETADKHQVWLTHGEHFQAHHLIYQALKNRYGEKDQRTIKMGHAIGRMSTGPLKTTLTKKQYEEARKISDAANKLRMNTPEAKARTSSAHKGKKYDEETREKIANARKGSTASPEAIENMKKAQQTINERLGDEKNNQLKKATETRWAKEGAKEKHKEVLANRWEDENARKSYGDKFKVKKWFNNGRTNLRLEEKEIIPEGYKAGRYQSPEQKETRAQKLKETAERKRKEKEQG